MFAGTKFPLFRPPMKVAEVGAVDPVSPTEGLVAEIDPEILRLPEASRFKGSSSPPLLKAPT
jgi:hypothetical protein